jgi:hypothetical protein
MGESEEIRKAKDRARKLKTFAEDRRELVRHGAVNLLHGVIEVEALIKQEEALGQLGGRRRGGSAFAPALAPSDSHSSLLQLEEMVFNLERTVAELEKQQHGNEKRQTKVLIAEQEVVKLKEAACADTERQKTHRQEMNEEGFVLVEVGNLLQMKELQENVEIIKADTRERWETVFQCHTMDRGGFELGGQTSGDCKRQQKSFKLGDAKAKAKLACESSRRTAAAAVAIITLFQAIAVLCFGDLYQALELSLLLSLAGCARQSGHIDMCERCIMAAEFSNVPHIGIILPVEDAAELVVWPRSHLLVQEESKSSYRYGCGAEYPNSEGSRLSAANVGAAAGLVPGEVIGAKVVRVPVGYALAFRADLVHAGQANKGEKDSYRLHCFCLANGCSRGEAKTGLVPKSVSDLCKDCLVIDYGRKRQRTEEGSE